MSCKPASKKSCSSAKKRAGEIIKGLNESKSKKYSFMVKRVGSYNTSTMVKVKNEFIDLDYQIIVTEENEKLSANNLRKHFYSEISKVLKKSEKIEQSTSCTTVVNNHQGYSIDFPVLKKLNTGEMQIARRNNKPENITKNAFDWNQLKDYQEAHKKYKNFDQRKKSDVRDKIIKNKCNEKSKDESIRKPSIVIFVEVVNNEK